MRMYNYTAKRVDGTTFGTTSYFQATTSGNVIEKISISKTDTKTPINSNTPPAKSHP